MGLPHDMGRYIGRPIEWTIDEQGDTKIPTFVCRFALDQYRYSTDWQPAEAGLEITAYVYLLKKDGQPNTFNINSLKDSLGWDGKSIAGLANSDWSQTEVQLTIDAEEYKGKRQVKVQFINPRDWTGSIKKAEPQQIISLDQRYGPMLRALAGQSGNGAAKPAASPAAGAPTTTPRRDAWKVFQEQNPGKDADALAELWKAEIASQFPGKTQKELAPTDWVEMAKKLRAPKVPAGDLELDEGESFKEDDIPF